eukprot:jgi/Chrzof1/3863/Cz13g11170.t1
MALALEEFKALCGFVPPGELKQAFQRTPELTAVIGQDASSAVLEASDASSFQSALQQAFSALMTADDDKVSAAIQILVARLRREQQSGESLGPTKSLVLQLNDQYPRDVGVLAAFFMNLVTLAAGEAICLPANHIHAYVSGQLLECMATSDNVINAAFTGGGERQGKLMCETLCYSTSAPTTLAGESITSHIKVYRPPVGEFEIQSINIPADAQEVCVPANEGPMILLVQHGTGAAKAKASIKDDMLQDQMDLHAGSTIFVPANTALQLGTSGEEPLIIWAAACNAKMFATAAPAGA